MRVSVITHDKYLFRLAQIRLGSNAEAIMKFESNADFIIYDCDSGLKLPETSIPVIKVSRNKNDGTVSLPLPFSFFDELLSKKKEKPALSLSADGRRAVFKGREIKLTTHEAALLSLLLRGGESYTSRSDIANAVWGEASDGLINIYIHYLREKLEADGEKVILSSRKYGYKINPSYITAANGDSREKGDLT